VSTAVTVVHTEATPSPAHERPHLLLDTMVITFSDGRNLIW